MAPHDTNTPKEVRRHWPSLIGMGVLLLVVMLGFLWWVSHSLEGRDEAAPAVEGQTTTTEPVELTRRQKV